MANSIARAQGYRLRPRLSRRAPISFEGRISQSLYIRVISPKLGTRQAPEPADVWRQPRYSAGRQALSDSLGDFGDRRRVTLSGSGPVEWEPVPIPPGKHVNVQMRHCLVGRYTIGLDQA